MTKEKICLTEMELKVMHLFLDEKMIDDKEIARILRRLAYKLEF